ncbi:hypothetical protein [Pedobacter riviphilus]|uniref:hypothetical protein n=1 Tax=Pedobacter riviphilus TaxID=2766984 RepID=UPI001CC25F66|nr:hypothetical protein [Pedobacter riviphilus]
MNNNLLAKAVQDYISANLNADVNQVALAKSPFEGITPAELATQIISKKKSEKKLPTWFNTEDIYYPQYYLLNKLLLKLLRNINPNWLKVIH